MKCSQASGGLFAFALAKLFWGEAVFGFEHPTEVGRIVETVHKGYIGN